MIWLISNDLLVVLVKIILLDNVLVSILAICMEMFEPYKNDFLALVIDSD